MDIRGIEDIQGIRVVPGVGVEIGALTPLSTIEDSEFMRRNYRVLYEAVSTVASPILRNMGTIGGENFLGTRCGLDNPALPLRRSSGVFVQKEGGPCYLLNPGKMFLASL